MLRFKELADATMTVWHDQLKRRSNMMGKETKLVNDILIMIGKEFPATVRAWRNNSGALRDDDGRMVRFGLTGSPDIIGCCAGQFFGIECKVGVGKQSPRQMAFEQAITAVGGSYIVARTVPVAELFLRGVLALPNAWRRE